MDPSGLGFFWLGSYINTWLSSGSATNNTSRCFVALGQTCGTLHGRRIVESSELRTRFIPPGKTAPGTWFTSATPTGENTCGGTACELFEQPALTSTNVARSVRNIVAFDILEFTRVGRQPA